MTERPKRFGEPTPLFDLMDQAPDFNKKLEVLKKFKPVLSGGQLGLAGAILIKCSDAEGLYNGYQGLADMIGMDYLHIMSGMHVLRAGTPEEIQSVKDGKRGLNKLYREVVKRSPLPSSQRRYKGSSYKGRNIQRRQDHHDRAEMWKMLRAALDSLTSLPLPSEFSAEVRKNVWMRNYTDQKLDQALNWLKDFADAYRTQQGHQEGGEVAREGQTGDDHVEPGEGGGTSGPQYSQSSG